MAWGLERLDRPILCVVGPTATGKSDLAVRLAEALATEVISADSMQVYRGMDIGTAKVTPAEMCGVPHHLLNVVNPDEPFTAADWAARARALIDGMHARAKIPIVVGGTGLYIKALTEDLDFAEQPASHALRAQWQTYLDTYGPVALHQALADRDPASAARLHPNDVRRVTRALEVCETGVAAMSEGYNWSFRGGRYQTLQIGLYVPRDVLYRRVDERVRRMVEQGLAAEVEGLLRRGYDAGLTAMQAIGYKEMAKAVAGTISDEQAIALIQQATRRFVKRQLSWFMRDPRVQWFWNHLAHNHPSPIDGILQTVSLMAEGFHHEQGEYAVRYHGTDWRIRQHE